MQSLNSRFRKKDIPTDVLSFPAPHNLADKISGDIAISAEIAQDNAKCLGHSGIEEIQILVLHGVLHLAGLDHERDNGEMARKEMRLRRTLGLPTGLIERTSSPSTAKSRKNSLTTTSARLKSKTPRKSG
jgi:probable rRNA maturation factor